MSYSLQYLSFGDACYINIVLFTDKLHGKTLNRIMHVSDIIILPVSLQGMDEIIYLYIFLKG